MADSKAVAAPRVVIGIDLGDKHSQVFAADFGTGEVIEEGRVAMRPDAIDAKFRGYERSRIVIEAGGQSAWVRDLLVEMGHEVFVANPRKLKLISQSDRKSDRLDAQLLAELGRASVRLLSPVTPRGKESRTDLTVLRGRDLVVQMRTMIVNHVRTTVKGAGARVRSCDAHGFHRHAFDDVPDDQKPALAPLFRVLEAVAKEVKTYDKKIDELAEKKYPEAQRLAQVAGVGNLTALAFVLTVDDPSRFDSSRRLASYLGLTPRMQESGESSPQLRITKAGNSFMRRLLVQAAHYNVGPLGAKFDSDLRRWGLKLAERGGKNGKKRAVVAVARKLAVLLHRLWVTGDDYEPLRIATKRGEVVTEACPSAVAS